MICLKISIFVVSNTTEALRANLVLELWFAWKFLSLWYQTQLILNSSNPSASCDLLENFYLCGIKHNDSMVSVSELLVVICLKISIFVVSNTTHPCRSACSGMLWFAWKFLSLWYQTQHYDTVWIWKYSCDLLENFYLCGIKHN